MDYTSAQAHFPFHHFLNTRWRDLDAFGHINNAIFLTYFEDARIDAAQHWDIDDPRRSIIAASIHIDYLQQLAHPTPLWVGTRICRIGNTSFDTQSILYPVDHDTPIAKATTTIVCFDYQQQTTVPVFDSIKAHFSE